MVSVPDFQLTLEYAPPRVDSVELTRIGRWMQLRRFAAGAIVATDDKRAISVWGGDLELNPDHDNFALDLIKVLQVLSTAGITAGQAHEILRKYPEYPAAARSSAAHC